MTVMFDTASMYHHAHSPIAVPCVEREVAGTLSDDSTAVAPSIALPSLEHTDQLSDVIAYSEAVLDSGDGNTQWLQSLLEVYANPKRVQQFLDSDLDNGLRCIACCRRLWENRWVFFGSLPLSLQHQVDRCCDLYPILSDLQKSKSYKEEKTALFQALFAQMMRSDAIFHEGQARCIQKVFRDATVENYAQVISIRRSEEKLSAINFLQERVPRALWMAPSVARDGRCFGSVWELHMHKAISLS